MSAILSTLSASTQNITTELLIGTYTASGEQWVLFQPRLSTLNAAAAVISYRLEHTTSADVVLAYRADSFSGAKNAAANTTFGERALGPVLLANGEKLKLYALSTNAADTSVTVSIRVLDACTLLSNQDKTDYSLTLANIDSIATSVWAYSTRTLSSFGTLVSDIWSNSTRTLSSYGTLVSDIWSNSTRTLTSYGTLIADIWAYSTRTLTSYGTLVSDIWANVTRSLTDKANFTLATSDHTSIATVVWSNATRTLSSYGTLVSDIWSNVTRSLTDKANFTLASGEFTSIASAVWNNATRTLSTYGTLIADIWGYTTRSLTDKTDFGLSTSERVSLSTAIWGYATRTLTSASGVASDIWAYATRSITEKTGFSLSSAAYSDTAHAVWDEPTSDHNISNTYGEKLDVKVSTRLAATDYVNPTSEFNKLRYVNNAIYIDTVNGVAGTVVGDNGTPENPVNNLNDARTLADSLNYNTYCLISGSSITLTSSHTNWYFNCNGMATIDLGGQDVGNSYFYMISITGTQGGTQRINCYHCEFSGVLNGLINCTDSGLTGNNSLRAGSHYFNHCYSQVAGNSTPIIIYADSTGITNVGFRLYSGGIEIRNMTSSHTMSYDCPTGQLRIHSSCLGGSISRRGLHNLVDQANGVCTFTQSAAIDRDVINAVVWNDGVLFNPPTTPPTRTLTSMGSIADDVWLSSTRSLTDKTDFELATTEHANIAIAVWEYSTRTLTSIADTAADIWTYATRSLTDKTDFELAASEYTNIATSVWGATTRTLSSLSSVASDIWAYATRTITDKLGFTLTTSDKNDIAGRVWDTTTTGHDNTGTFGKRVDASITTRLATTDYVNPTSEFNKLRYVNNAIYIDTLNGSAGTIVGDNGTPENPVNNLNDARTLADDLGYRKYILVSGSSVTLVSSHTQWYFESNGNATVDLGEQDVSETAFMRCTVTGTQGGTGRIHCEKCNVFDINHLLGTLFQCGVYGTHNVAAGSTYYDHCFSEDPIVGSWTIDFDSTDFTNISIQLFSGGLTVSHMSANHIMKYNCPTGRITLTSSCTGGQLLHRGLSNITNNASVSPTFNNVCAIDRDIIKSLVWTDSTSRTLTSFGTLPSDVWSNGTRSLTDKEDFSLADGSIIGDTLATSAITKIQSGVAEEIDLAAVHSDVNLIMGVTDKVNTMIEQDGLVYRFTENSLENSPVGTGGFTSNDRTSLETVEGFVANLDSMIEYHDTSYYRYKANSLELSPVGTGGFTDDDRTKITTSYNLLTDPDHGLVDIDTELDSVESIVSAIKTQTDKLNFTGTDVKATLDGESVSLTDGSITASKYTAGAISASVFANDVVSTLQAGLATQALLQDVDDEVDAIRTQTDKLNFNASNDVKATLDNEQVVLANYSITNTKYASGAITASSFAADVVPALQSGLATQELLMDVDAELDTVALKTNQLQFNDSGVIASLNGEKVTVSSNEDKTGYVISGTGISEIVTDVWNYADRSLTDATLIEESLSSIKAKTDLLTFVGNDIKSTLDGETVVLADGSITSSKYATGAINAAVFAADVVTTLQSGLATESMLEDVDIEVDAIRVQTDKLNFNASNDVKATLDNEQVVPADFSISSTKFASDAITSNVIATSAVTEIQNGVARQSTLDEFAPYFDAVKNQTDQLQFNENGVIASLNGEKVTVSSNEDKTGYALSGTNVSAISLQVWNNSERSLTDKENFSLTTDYNASMTPSFNETDRITLNAVKSKTDQLPLVEDIVSGTLAGVIDGTVDLQEATKRIMACIVNSSVMDKDSEGNRIFNFKDASGEDYIVQHVVSYNGTTRELS